MKIRELKYIESHYDAEKGVSIVVMRAGGIDYVGTAYLAEGDEWLASEIIGGTYAEIRARIAYCRDIANDFRKLYIINRNKMLKYPKSRRLIKKDKELTDKIAYYTRAASRLQKDLYLDINARPNRIKKIQELKKELNND